MGLIDDLPPGRIGVDDAIAQTVEQAEQDDAVLIWFLSVS